VACVCLILAELAEPDFKQVLLDGGYGSRGLCMDGIVRYDEQHNASKVWQDKPIMCEGSQLLYTHQHLIKHVDLSDLK
jgi:hypothetical protein